MSSVVEIYRTVRNGDPFLIIDSPDNEVSGNLNVLQNLDVCGNITFNNIDLSSALANLEVDLTGGQDASFTNVDISGSLILNNIDISGKLTQIDVSLIDLANLSNNIESLTGTVDSTNYDYIHVTTSQHVTSSWSYGSELSITTARAGMLIDGGLFIHASDPQGNGSGTKSILDSINEQFATNGDVPLEADFMVEGNSHLIGNTYIGPRGNLILFGDIMGSTGQTILSSSGIRIESDLNVLNVGSDPKSYSSGISGEVLTSQGSSGPPIWGNGGGGGGGGGTAVYFSATAAGDSVVGYHQAITWLFPTSYVGGPGTTGLGSDPTNINCNSHENIWLNGEVEIPISGVYVIQMALNYYDVTYRLSHTAVRLEKKPAPPSNAGWLTQTEDGWMNFSHEIERKNRDGVFIEAEDMTTRHTRGSFMGRFYAGDKLRLVANFGSSGASGNVKLQEYSGGTSYLRGHMIHAI